MSSTDSSPIKPVHHLLHAPDLPIAAVTVFTDRAEVKRVFSHKLAKGLNELLIEYVANSIIGDSIRVDGHGSAVIHEVQFKMQHLKADAISNKKVDELKKLLDELHSQRDVLEDTNSLIETQLSALCELIKNLGRNIITGDSASKMQFDNNSEQTVWKLYEFYEKKSLQLKERIRASANQIKDLQTRIEKTERELKEAKSNVKNSVAITLQNEEGADNEVELTLTYQVRRARWTPSYDVRVNTGEAGDEQLLRNIQLTYFGNIRQETGEDWHNVPLTLSTSQPSAGQLPKLGTTIAKFVQKEPPMPRAQAKCYMAMTEAEDMESDEDMGMGVPPVMATRKKMAVETSTSEQQLMATTFGIPQPKTIPSDDSDHKVTIALLEFASVPHFDCVPSKSTAVYLSAAATNSSAFPLLAGLASVYMNNCFTQKVHIDGVATGEHFDIPLGVYSAVKVIYKPAHKYHHQTGMLSKSAVQVHEQRIQLKNTKATPRMVTIVEPVPKATDEKIKIRLLSPELSSQKAPKGANGSAQRKGSSSTASTVEEQQPREDKAGLPLVGAVLNADHNLEWTVLLPEGGKETELLVKWEVEYPPSEQLEFKEKH